MMLRNFLLPFLSLTVLAGAVSAQRRKPVNPVPPHIQREDTTIKNTTLEVYQLYQPELKPIIKPEFSPVIPPPPVPSPQQYDVPQQTLYYSYRALPLRPLALGKDSIGKEPQNYALLAGGNLATILGEAGVGSLSGRDWQSTLQGRYITQHSDLQGQIFRSFGLKGDATLLKGNHLLEGGLSVARNVFGRYGFDHGLYQHSFEDLRAVYSAASISVGAANTQPGPWGTSYHPQLSFGSFDASRIGHETMLNILLPATKQIDSLFSLSLALNVWLAWTTIGDEKRSNHVVQLAPAADCQQGNFMAHAGIYPTLGEDGKLRLMPDITASWLFAHGGIKASAGWQSRYIQNTLQQLTTINPFIEPTRYDRYQARRSEVFGGLSFSIAEHLSAWGRVAWQRTEGLPLFINTPAGDSKDFSLVYDFDVQAIVGEGGVQYAIGESFSVGAKGAWYNYYRHTYDHVWGEPAVRLKGNVSLRVIRGLIVNAYAEVLDKIWGQDAAGNSAKLRGVFDLGAGAEYSFGSGFSGLLRADNILGRKNERWLGYPSFGFNIYGGLRYRF